MASAIFDEIRDMVKTNDLDDSAALRMILCGMIDISDRLDNHRHEKTEKAVESLEKRDLAALIAAGFAAIGAGLAWLKP
jgi:cystathionine beta-lyase/cystathionine gamma-synthase